MYIVSNGAIKTPKSVLFPSVVKSLRNNTESLKLINKYGHGIGYNLIEEIETEYALQVINKKKENGVIIRREIEKNEHNQQVALMIANNIDNLDSTLGSGTSHRVNSILAMKGKQLRRMLWLMRHKKDLQKESADDPYQQILWRDRFLIAMEGSAWDQEN